MTIEKRSLQRFYTTCFKPFETAPLGGFEERTKKVPQKTKLLRHPLL